MSPETDEAPQKSHKSESGTKTPTPSRKFSLQQLACLPDHESKVMRTKHPVSHVLSPRHLQGKVRESVGPNLEIPSLVRFAGPLRSRQPALIYTL